MAGTNLAMTFAEALRIVQSAPRDVPEFPVALIAGSTPEPFSYFLAAHLQERMPDRLVQVEGGRFGDLAGNLERLSHKQAPAVMLLEWADLDARLGFRDGGRWGRDAAADILDSVGLRLAQLAALLAERPYAPTLIVVGPTLPLPPVIPVPRWQRSALDSGLDILMSGFLAKAAELPGCRVLSNHWLAGVRMEDRLDLRSWWLAGSPYRRSFGSLLAASIAGVLSAPPRCKGIITDLDGTLWSGILGDTGPQGVHWDLEHRAALHGVYQQFLETLAADGVLLAIASKNDRSLALEALQRPDLRLPVQAFFPIEAHWQPKSESAARILAAWNIGPGEVVFVDDSPLEVALMRAAFPAMDCREFPADDPDVFVDLVGRLADLFGQAERGEEDRLRTASVRRGAGWAEDLKRGDSAEALLRGSQAELTIRKLQDPPDPRALELVNKTNQFNLNGRRYTETEWLQYLRGGGVAWIASYRDKFGALGKVGVLAGHRRGPSLEIDAWALSCRAFSRRIEHAMLEFLFREQGAGETTVSRLTLRFQCTQRNTPLREFLESVSGGEVTGCWLGEGEVNLSRAQFEAVRPELYGLI